MAAAVTRQAVCYSLEGSFPNHVVVASLKDGSTICTDDHCKTAKDPVASALYNTVTRIHCFIRSKFGIKGIDGKGTMAHLYIHWDEDNAAWSCETGSCVWRFNSRYALDPKVVGHEYMHAVVSKFAGLNYREESGALDEAMADVMGLAFSEWFTGITSWTIIDRDLSRCIDMRSFQRLTPREVPSERNDYGYVHDNGRIPSHAFFYAVREFNGLLHGKVLHVWFNAILKASRNETFVEFANKTICFAQDLQDSQLVSAVTYSWLHVQVLKQQIPRSIGRAKDLAVYLI